MSVHLTEKGVTEVARLRTRYKQLQPEYKTNAADRLIFENGHLPFSLIVFVISNLSGEDYEVLREQGFIM